MVGEVFEIPIIFDQQQQSISRLKHLSTVRSVSLPDENDQCRICLMSGGRLISTCKCKGSLKLIHEECLQHWIEKKVVSNGAEVCCQLCHEWYQYTMEIERTCQRSTLPGRIIFMAVSFIVVLTCTIILTWLLASTQGNDELAKKLFFFDFMKILYVLLLVISYVAIGIMVITFINKYCMHESLKVQLTTSQKVNRFKVMKVVVKHT